MNMADLPRAFAPVSFFVGGTPAKKGSMKILRAKNGRSYVHHDDDRLESWANSVGWMARTQWRGQPWDGPVFVEIKAFFARPRTTTLLAPAKNDPDKIARAILDALTGIVYVDDGQVVSLTCTKAWGEPGAQITVSEAAWDGQGWQKR